MTLKPIGYAVGDSITVKLSTDLDNAVELDNDCAAMDIPFAVIPDLIEALNQVVRDAEQ